MGGMKEKSSVRRVLRWCVDRWGGVLAVGAVACWPAIAGAQPRAAPFQDESSALMQWAFVVIAAGFVVAIASKNPKRSHKD
jgi:hypothetical protein